MRTLSKEDKRKILQYVIGGIVIGAIWGAFVEIPQSDWYGYAGRIVFSAVVPLLLFFGLRKIKENNKE